MTSLLLSAIIETIFEGTKLCLAQNQEERHNKEETKVGKDMFVKQATEVIKKVVNILKQKIFQFMIYLFASFYLKLKG